MGDSAFVPGQGGWICPSGLRFPKPALIYPSSTLSRGTQLYRRVTVSNRSEIGRKAKTDMCPTVVVPSSGIEPASPALQAGAITRSASRAKVWPGTRDLVPGSCPATGMIVKDHPRPSPGLLPRFIGTSESFGIRADLSRSRPAVSFAVPRDRTQK